jgi:hypothetical protein
MRFIVEKLGLGQVFPEHFRLSILILPTAAHLSISIVTIIIRAGIIGPRVATVPKEIIYMLQFYLICTDTEFYVLQEMYPSLHSIQTCSLALTQSPIHL